MDARKLTVQLLLQTQEQKQYSNLALDRALEQTKLPESERRLCAALYYGVLERRITLDAILQQYSKRPLRKLDPVVLQILRVGLYELCCLERIPDAVAIHTSVELTRTFRKASASGFVNAVLRQYLRDGKPLPSVQDPLQAAALADAVPLWLEQRLTEQYGEMAARAFFANALLPPPVTLRRNPLMGTETAFAQLKLPVKPHPVLKDAYFLDGGSVRRLPAFSEGWFHVQDAASQVCCLALGVKPGETVLDLCAAPGGKSFTLAQMMQDTGRLLAFDLQSARVELIRQGAKRLHLHCITAEPGDASVYRPELPKADRILCDVPCSGLGVIRRKPEIREKDPGELAQLPAVQLRILETAARYLKETGTLIYSTCTLLKEENEQVVGQFLQRHPQWEATAVLPDLGAPFDQPMVTLLPELWNNDGFFLAKLRYRKEG